MIKESVTIVNKFGLHTRAAAKLVNTAAKFASKIQIQRNDKLADCKSIMSLIMLGLTKNMTIDLITAGEDEAEASEAVVALIKNCFGEGE